MRIERVTILALTAFVLMASGLGRVAHEALDHRHADETSSHQQPEHRDCGSTNHDDAAEHDASLPEPAEDCGTCDLLIPGAKALPGVTLAGVLDARPTGMLAAGASARLVRFELAAHPARGPPATLLA
jgi:hypothetical protein